MWIPTALKHRKSEAAVLIAPFLRLHDERVVAFRKEPNLHREFYQPRHFARHPIKMSSDEIDTLRRSKISTTVVTAN